MKFYYVLRYTGIILYTKRRHSHKLPRRLAKAFEVSVLTPMDAETLRIFGEVHIAYKNLPPKIRLKLEGSQKC